MFALSSGRMGGIWQDFLRGLKVVGLSAARRQSEKTTRSAIRPLSRGHDQLRVRQSDATRKKAGERRAGNSHEPLMLGRRLAIGPAM